MNQELVEKYPKLQGMTNESINKSIECHEKLIQEMYKLYSDDFEKRYIKRILGKNWEVEEFNEAFFTIIDDKKSTVKVEFDTFGEIWVDTINLFLYEPIYFRDGSYINELKAIIKLYEHKEDLKEFICKFIQAIDPMYESVRILKLALK